MRSGGIEILIGQKSNNSVNIMPCSETKELIWESARLRKRIVLLTAVCMLAVLLVVSPLLSARQGGVPSSTQEYDCGGSCHNVLSSATISMTASNLTPSPGQSLTVTVNVNGGQSGNLLGVMVVSSLSPVQASVPTSAGWGISSDPSGSTQFNYYEIPNYASQTSMTWTLIAPSQEGTYTLYARAMHGGGAEYAKDYVSGLSFTVGNVATPGFPDVIITSPTSGSEVKGTITVNANIPSDNPIAFASLKIDGNEIGNKSIAPFAWNIDTQAYADGNHVINITAVDTIGRAGYKQVTVTVDNAAVNTELLAWVWTMAAGTIAIVAWTAVMIVIALMIRRRHISKGAK